MSCGRAVGGYGAKRFSVLLHEHGLGDRHDANTTGRQDAFQFTSEAVSSGPAARVCRSRMQEFVLWFASEAAALLPFGKWSCLYRGELAQHHPVVRPR